MQLIKCINFICKLYSESSPCNHTHKQTAVDKPPLWNSVWAVQTCDEKFSQLDCCHKQLLPSAQANAFGITQLDFSFVLSSHEPRLTGSHSHKNLHFDETAHSLRGHSRKWPVLVITTFLRCLLMGASTVMRNAIFLSCYD